MTLENMNTLESKLTKSMSSSSQFLWKDCKDDIRKEVLALCQKIDPSADASVLGGVSSALALPSQKAVRGENLFCNKLKYASGAYERLSPAIKIAQAQAVGSEIVTMTQFNDRSTVESIVTQLYLQ